ncbi:MAG TPA: ATP-binding protein [Ignavibacteriaceae bacterium]|nr:ATP-binding protein [Ignavibacteriaceae bacterium]
MIKVLIVEDELIVALELKSRLLDLGYSICGIVASGEEAIELTAKENPDLILMDINIKGAYDGVKTSEILKIDYDIPIIFITAFSDPKTLQRVKVTEPYGYIIKPFEERELHTAIEIALYKHNMEKKLRDSERRLSITLKSIGDGVIATNHEGIINYLNPAAESLTGYNSADAIGKNIIDILHFKDGENIRIAKAAKDELLAFGATKNFPASAVLVCRNGKEIVIETDAAAIKDNKEKINGIVLSFRDITERKKMEAELKIALDKALESNRLKSIFLSNMSHELRTPMVGILGFTQILKDELSDKHNGEMLGMIADAGNRLLSTLDSILEYSNFESKKTSVILKEIYLADLESNLRHKFESITEQKGLKLNIDLRKNNITVLADEKLLERAVHNIVDNAVKFTHVGIINIETDENRKNGRPWGIIRIADTGIGISPEKMNIIFDEFRQVSEGGARTYEGSGLGLTIAKKSIELMEGKIKVESEIGKGSKFNIYLPRMNKTS